MLSLIYLILITMNDSFTFHPILPLALEGLNVLFFLIGGIALAAKLDVHSCSNDVRPTAKIIVLRLKSLPITGLH